MTAKGNGTTIIETAVVTDGVNSAKERTEDEFLFNFDVILIHDAAENWAVERVNNLSIDEAYV